MKFIDKSSYGPASAASVLASETLGIAVFVGDGARFFEQVLSTPMISLCFQSRAYAIEHHRFDGSFFFFRFSPRHRSGKFENSARTMYRLDLDVAGETCDILR